MFSDLLALKEASGTRSPPSWRGALTNAPAGAGRGRGTGYGPSIKIRGLDLNRPDRPICPPPGSNAMAGSSCARIMPGFRADLTCLSGDPFGVDPSELSSLKIRATMVDGVTTYEARA